MGLLPGLQAALPYWQAKQRRSLADFQETALAFAGKPCRAGCEGGLWAGWGRGNS